MAVHEIRKGIKGAGTSAVLTDQLSTLNPELREFFEQRIITAASSDDSFRAEFLSGTETTSPLRGLCNDVLMGSKELLEPSRDAALHLARVQPGSSSGGLLAVASVQFSNAPGLVFLKMEHVQGVKIETVELPDGTRIVELEHIKDLIVSAHTRLHKQAFIQIYDTDTYLLEVSDHQRPFKSKIAIAQFFLRDFLGARTTIDSRDATKRFVEATEELIAGLTDPQRQAEIRLSLASELRSQKNTITPAQFAQEHLEPAELTSFNAAVDGEDVPQNFEKDTALVAQIMDKMKMVGENGMIVLGPTTEWADRVTVNLLGAGEANVTVRDNFRVN